MIIIVSRTDLPDLPDLLEQRQTQYNLSVSRPGLLHCLSVWYATCHLSWPDAVFNLPEHRWTQYFTTGQDRHLLTPSCGTKIPPLDILWDLWTRNHTRGHVNLTLTCQVLADTRVTEAAKSNLVEWMLRN